MNLYQYNHFDTETKTIAEGQAVKDVLIWAETSPGADYTDITTPELQQAHEVDLIRARKTDGIAAYQKKSSELRLGRIAAGTPHEEYHTKVYTPMAPIITAIESGNWVTAYDGIAGITTNDILDSAMLTSFKVEIATYLTQSGNYPEFTGMTVDANGDIS